MSGNSLNVSKLSDLFLYNPATGNLHWRKSRPPAKAGEVAGCVGAQGYVQVRVDGKTVKAHRVVMAMLLGRDLNYFEVVDHVNGDRSDNRQSNLRLASRAENSWNSRLPKDNTSGRKGVTWNARKGKWVARLQKDGKRLFVGYFETAEAAAIVLEEFRLKHHGEFARNE